MAGRCGLQIGLHVMQHVFDECRGDYGIDVGRNIIHGSDAVEVSRQYRAVCLPSCLLLPVATCCEHSVGCRTGHTHDSHEHQHADLLFCDYGGVLQSAQKEIALWFKPEELADYEPVIKPAIYE